MGPEELRLLRQDTEMRIRRRESDHDYSAAVDSQSHYDTKRQCWKRGLWKSATLLTQAGVEITTNVPTHHPAMTLARISPMSCIRRRQTSMSTEHAPHAIVQSKIPCRGAT